MRKIYVHGHNEAEIGVALKLLTPEFINGGNITEQTCIDLVDFISSSKYVLYGKGMILEDREVSCLAKALEIFRKKIKPSVKSESEIAFVGGLGKFEELDNYLMSLEDKIKNELSIRGIECKS